MDEMTQPTPAVLIYQSDIVEPRSIEFAERKLAEISETIAAARAAENEACARIVDEYSNSMQSVATSIARLIRCRLKQGIGE